MGKLDFFPHPPPRPPQCGRTKCYCTCEFALLSLSVQSLSSYMALCLRIRDCWQLCWYQYSQSDFRNFMWVKFWVLNWSIIFPLEKYASQINFLANLGNHGGNSFNLWGTTIVQSLKYDSEKLRASNTYSARHTNQKAL